MPYAFTAYYATGKTPHPRPAALCRRGKGVPCFQPYPRKKLSSVFQGRSQACRHPLKPTSTPKSSCRVPADPLSIIAKHPLKDADAPDKPLVFFCHSGNRTANASDLLERLAGDVQAYRLDGGISGWEKAGLPVEHISSTIPLFRQIQIAAGSLVLIGVIGSAFWHPFFWLSAFVGAGLVFAGISGFCGLGVLLSHMPWNRR
ncbi:MAG: rhodanese-like domain-containing protein [Bilophila wadsworthia]